MKILYVTTISSTMGFFSEHFKMLLDKGNTIDLACNFEYPLAEKIKVFDFKEYHIPFSRKVFNVNNLVAYRKLKQVIEEGEYDIVHCHTPNAAAITRLACRKLRKKNLKVFYTAHGFHFYKGAPKKNWMFFYPIELICSLFTDILITINGEDYKLAQKKMRAKKVEYIPGVGVDVSKFRKKNIDYIEKRSNFTVPPNATLLLSVGELNVNKNHEIVIRAIKQLNETNIYYLIAGEGSRHEYLEKLINELELSDQIKLLGFRTDIRELMSVADMFIFPSYREGLSVSLMEAMSCGLPCIVSNIRGNIDLINENGGEIFDPKSVEDCRRAINSILGKDLRSMGQHNEEFVNCFSNDIVLQSMRRIYEIE